MKETSQWDFSWSRKTFQEAHPTHTFSLYLQTEKILEVIIVVSW